MCLTSLKWMVKFSLVFSGLEFYHRITWWSGSKKTFRQEHLPLDQIVQNLIQPGLIISCVYFFQFFTIKPENIDFSPSFLFTTVLKVGCPILSGFLITYNKIGGKFCSPSIALYTFVRYMLNYRGKRGKNHYTFVWMEKWKSHHDPVILLLLR